ncbi:hypothetical protein BE21_43795 [Sorangium cellulosum]|uniref:Uncharacterized protein n=1 Tax=Sorangium cellulosum TaxID=56 RepID=A0A150TJV5_SORCE|nr:hypothetical protein BE21_43795 [Sorangium cellulosum]
MPKYVGPHAAAPGSSCVIPKALQHRRAERGAGIVHPRDDRAAVLPLGPEVAQPAPSLRGLEHEISDIARQPGESALHLLDNRRLGHHRPRTGSPIQRLGAPGRP